MADTFTTKLGLRQYDPLLNYDVNKLSADMLKIDNAFGTVICTSSTRPSTGLFNGHTIYETDTGRTLVRNAGAWLFETAYILPVANATARNALTPVWDGFTIYRVDMDWLEIYDGAAWRVQGTQATASLANITNPMVNQMAMLTTDLTIYRWTGAAWVRLAQDSVTDRQAVAFGTTTSTSYTSTLGASGVVAGKAFVAPGSGMVLIYNSCYMFNSGANGTYCTIRVRTGATVGSGTDAFAEFDEHALINTTANGLSLSRPVLVTGLTPLATYNVQQRVRVDAGTGTFNRHSVIVTPQ